MSILGVHTQTDNYDRKLFDTKMKDGKGRPTKPFYTGNKTPATQVRILPARDHSLSPEDPTFETSFVPYRDADSAVRYRDTGTPMFSNWVVKVSGYKFLGSKGHNLLSPLTLRGPDNPDARDPVQDMAAVARTHPDWVKLTEEKNINGRRVTELPKLKEFGYMNLLTLNQPTPEGYAVQTCRLPWVTVLNLFDQLCWRTSHGDEPVDPDWPKFLLGDITSPKYGLAGVLGMGKSPTSGFQQPEFSFTSIPQEPKWFYGKYSLDLDDPSRKAFAEYVLSQRVDIWDSENGALKFYSYGEIVEALYEDGAYPVDLIAKACAPHCDLPDYIKKAATYSTPTGAHTTCPPAAAPAPGQPVPSSVPTAPATPAAPPTYTAPPAATMPAPSPAPAPGQPVPSSVPTAPATPAAPAPGQPVPSSVPTAPATPQAPSGTERNPPPATASSAVAQNSLDSWNLDALTAEEQEQFKKLQPRFIAKDTLTPEEMKVFMELSGKLRK